MRGDQYHGTKKGSKKAAAFNEILGMEFFDIDSLGLDRTIQQYADSRKARKPALKYPSDNKRNTQTQNICLQFNRLCVILGAVKINCKGVIYDNGCERY